MAVTCGDGCHIICDFCAHYKDDFTDGEFQGEGVCLINNVRTDACNYCEDDFLCFRMKKK